MRRAAAFLLFATLACTSTKPPADDATRQMIARVTEALEKQPDSAPLLYILATYHDRAHDAASVVKSLTRLDELGWEHGVAPDGFRNTGTPAFRAIAAKLDAREPHVHRATTAFTLANQR